MLCLGAWLRNLLVVVEQRNNQPHNPPCFGVREAFGGHVSAPLLCVGKADAGAAVVLYGVVQRAKSTQCVLGTSRTDVARPFSTILMATSLPPHIVHLILLVPWPIVLCGPL